MPRHPFPIALAAITLLVAALPAHAADEPRTPEAIGQDLNATGKSLQQVMPSLTVLGEPDARKSIADKAIPLLKKMVNLFAELATVQKDPAEKAGILSQRADYQSYLVALGDPDTIATLTTQSKATDDTALLAQCALATGNWWNHAQDPAAQQKILDAFTPVVKAHPSDGIVVDTLSNLWHMGAANDDLKRKVIDIVRTDVQGSASHELLAEAKSWDARKALEGKPLTLAGRTSAGTTFTSADWKGKVILVDFWATWCVPCRAELPHIKELYTKYHDKGLEVVGIDCDDSDDPVNSFIKENAMPWPQLRESTPTDDGWHPLTKQLHVEALPTMFLIDKKGTLRHVEAGTNLDSKIQSLLAETP